MNKKMVDIDIDPFGEHESRPEEPTNEHIPLDPVTPGRSSIWELECEQETSFGGISHTSVLHKEYLVGKIYELMPFSDLQGVLNDQFHIVSDLFTEICLCLRILSYNRAILWYSGLIDLPRSG